MISIVCNQPVKLLPYLSEAGLLQSDYVFGPLTGASCIVIVGGAGVDYTHCYVQLHSSTPIISCLDPATVWGKSTNSIFITLALQKALAIDRGAKPLLFTSANYHVIDKPTEILSLLAEPELSIDIECDIETHELLCLAIAAGNRCYVVPFDNDGQPYWSVSDEVLVWRHLSILFANSSMKVMQNYIFDSMILWSWGLELHGPFYDTLIVNHLVQPELPKGLSSLARYWLMVEPWKGVSIYKSNPILWRYNAQDSVYTAHIKEAQLRHLNTYSKPALTLLMGVITPLLDEVLRCCTRGVNIDHRALSEMRGALTTQVDSMRQALEEKFTPLLAPDIKVTLRKGKPKEGVVYYTKDGAVVSVLPDTKKLSSLGEVYEHVVKPRAFNPTSSYHVKDILKALGYKIPSKKGKESGDELALKKLRYKAIQAGDADTAQFITDVLGYRKTSKMLGTYANMTLDDDGRLRFKLVLASEDGGTVTGRFSSKQTDWGTGCNIQNIPKGFRHIIIPNDPSEVIMNMDLKAADPHTVAWISGCDKMLQIMATGDIHAYTGSKIAGRDITQDPGYSKDDSVPRKLGKEANNGLNYGMAADKFADSVFKKTAIILSRAEAQKIIDVYFNEAFPELRVWQDSIWQQLCRTRTLTTPTGRTRYFYGEINTRMYMQALAYIAPTTVADTLNRIWVQFTYEAAIEGLRITSLFQVHDSLTFSVHRDDVKRAAALLHKCTECAKLIVNGVERNYRCDITWGPNWKEQNESYKQTPPTVSALNP